MKGKKQKAFTVIELLITIAVMVIIVSFVVPNFSRVIAQGKLSGTRNEALSLMHFARLEAMRTRSNVIVCASENGQTCSGDDWGRIIVFVDEDNNGQVSSGESIKRVASLSHPTITLANHMQGIPSIYFLPNGNAEFANGSISNTNILSLCSNKVDNASFTLQVGTTMGMTRVVKNQGDSSCQ